MQKRTFEDLILDGEDLFLEGDIIIYGKLEMKNANLIVSGDLTISCNDNVEIENGDIIVSGGLTLNSDINIKGVNISCNCLHYCDIDILDGDIWVNDDLEGCTIISDGNIEVGGNSDVDDITCLNYLVTGDNVSSNINASQDIYILGDNDSTDLTARDILINGICDTNNSPITAQEIVIDGDCDTDYSPITAHHFVCTGELSCEGLFIE